MSTIRVEVEVPALNEAQIRALRDVLHGRHPHWSDLTDDELDAIFDADLVVDDVRLSIIGRAVLEHYEREAG